MDAANIDLKAFTEDFYRKNCFGRLKPVLDTLKYVANETNTWLEITTLLIPGENDSPEEIDAMTAWIADNLGKNIPLHFSAFHPDFKMRDKPATPLNTVVRAMDIAKKNGINYIYAGNVVYPQGEITRCHNCGAELIKRNWYQIDMDKITAGTCPECGTQIPGRFI
jgi:pyruvate formate lyase activating enzyme